MLRISACLAFCRCHNVYFLSAGHLYLPGFPKENRHMCRSGIALRAAASGCLECRVPQMVQVYIQCTCTLYTRVLYYMRGLLAG